MFEHAADDAVASRMNLYADRLFVIFQIGNLVKKRIAVLQRYTLCQSVEIGTGERLIERNLVDFLLLVRWVRQLAGNVAVVCKQQQPERVFVQPSDRVDAFGASPLDQLHDRL